MRYHMIRKAVFSLLLTLALAALPLRAGENVWTPVGPDSGGSVTGLAVHPTDPRVVYAGTDGGGVFKSTDGGRSWRAVNQGLSNPFIRTLVMDPSNPEILYVGTGDIETLSLLDPSPVPAGVFQSVDGGATWVDKSDGLPHYTRGRFCICGRLPVDLLAINPRSPRVRYAVVRGVIYVRNQRDREWVPFPTPAAVKTLAFDPAGTLYAGTDRGVFKRPAGGQWVSASAGMGERQVFSLAIHPTNPRILYAGSGGVYKSVDAGASWQLMGEGLSGIFVLSLAIHPRQPSIVYAGTQVGLYRSVGARRWYPSGSGLPIGPVGVLAVSPSDPGVLYGGAAVIETFHNPEGIVGPTGTGGVFKTADGGTSWQILRRGIHAGLVTSLAASRTARVLYAGTSGQGVFRTDDGGVRWLAVNAGLTDLEVHSLAVDPADSRTAYAGTRWRVFKTTDGGASWSLGALLPVQAATAEDAVVVALAVDPRDRSTVFAATRQAVFKSTDGALSWRKVLEPPIRIFALAVSPSSEVYVGGRKPHFEELWKSRDGGETWEKIPMATPIFALWIDPEDGTIYAASGGVRRSTDGGASWVLDPDSGIGLSLAVDPGDPEVIYSANPIWGVYRWVEGEGGDFFNPGLFNPSVLAVATDPFSPGTVYAGTRGGGVYRLDRR